MDKVERYCRDRDAALLSLDEKKIRAFARKHAIKMPENETAFWAGVHKAIICLNAATDEQKRDSVFWLIAHGFEPYLEG